jgi:hypothetical protein
MAAGKTQEPPFATADGRPKPSAATNGAQDLVANPAGTVTPGSRNVVGESRRQGGTGAPPPASSDITAQSPRPKYVTDPQQRLGGNYGPRDGSDPLVPTPPSATPQWRAGTGSVGNARRPFKLRG